MREMPSWIDRPVITPGKPTHVERFAPGAACVICGARPCLRTVGRSGYCGVHTAEAYRAARVQKRQEGAE
jgi:hypothetical protein